MPEYIIVNGELHHAGIKGMKWGVRRYQNKDGSLTPAGIKRYAKKGYAEDSYNSNKTRAGKVYDRLTDAHKYGGDIMYNLSSEKERKARAEKYVADKNAKKQSKAKQKALEKEYGELEDQMTYGKNANAKKNAALEKRMAEIDNELNARSNAKKANKKAIEDLAKKLEKDASFGEKMLYNTATRKQAAKYVVENNMTVEDATKKAKGTAWRNTAALLAVVGGITLATNRR